MNKKYIVCLAEQERNMLEDIVGKGTAQAYKIKHANILLAVDVNGSWLSDKEAAKLFHCHENTVRNLRQRLVEQGLDAALLRKKQERPSRENVLDGSAEAKLIAMACVKPEEGRAKWSLRLLADKMVELEIVKTVSHETVRQTLKKTNCGLIAKSAG